ncbi:hypothetical protein [Luteolibacter sp. AS25]|uniref:hypothetical protein n=1 Tax=Luteolibacter sp. AS25 TaxID=3135776 RepID=UPI00398ABB0A
MTNLPEKRPTGEVGKNPNSPWEISEAVTISKEIQSSIQAQTAAVIYHHKKLRDIIFVCTATIVLAIIGPRIGEFATLIVFSCLIMAVVAKAVAEQFSKK